jgi:acyl carrier protein phosphodiesterase
MSKENWLLLYGSFDGLQRAFNGMASRTNFVSNMETAAETLRIKHQIFRQDFFDFFPELQAFAAREFPEAYST